MKRAMGKLEKQLDRFLRKQPKLGKGVYVTRGAVVAVRARQGFDGYRGCLDYHARSGGTSGLCATGLRLSVGILVCRTEL